MRATDNSPSSFTPVWESSSCRKSVVISYGTPGKSNPPPAVAGTGASPAALPKPRGKWGTGTLCALAACALLVISAAIWYEYAGVGIDSFHPLRDSRFTCWPVIQEPRPVHGVDLDTQSGIGWCRAGRAFPLVTPDLVLATHNALPDEVFFRTRDGTRVCRRIIERRTLLSGPDGRAQLQTGRLARAFLHAEVIPLTIPETTSGMLPKVVVFGRRGRTGVGHQIVVDPVNVLDGKLLPWWPGYALHGRTLDSFPGQIQASRGDSGSPVLVHQDGIWQLIGLTVSASSNAEGTPCATQHLYLPTLASLIRTNGQGAPTDEALKAGHSWFACVTKADGSGFP